MPNMEQIERQIEQLEMSKGKVNKQLDLKREEVADLVEQQKEIQDKIDKLRGTQEESDAAITTTTAGDISVPGGRGNFAPKIGGTINRFKNIKPSKISKLFKNCNKIDVYGKPAKKSKVYESNIRKYLDEFKD